MNKKGFTLIELLVAVIIMTLLVTMAVPLYEKTVEKSRAAEARVLLKKIADSKTRLLSSMELESFAGHVPSAFTAKSLDVQMSGTSSGRGSGAILTTDAFTYRFFPASDADKVCCSRRAGDTAGVSFWYDPTPAAGGDFYCTGGADKCSVYGMTSRSGGSCN
mgnify:CR=1 FL=1